MALLSARAIVWPDLPCYNTSWLAFKDHSPPFESPGCLLPHHVDGEEEEPQCLLMQSLHNHCLLVRGRARLSLSHTCLAINRPHAAAWM